MIAVRSIFPAVAAAAGLGLPFAHAMAQQIAPPTLDEVIVTATRVEKPLNQVPAAISVVQEADIQLGRQQLTLDESLVKVPGVFMQNRHNFAQALRISIRGFGARSPFGIRGIKLIIDGVPATLPDGAGNVDEIDLGSTNRVEVIRGPSSSLYGSSTGGVISVVTEDGPEIPYIHGRFTAGEFGKHYAQVKTGGQFDRLNYVLSGSYLDYEGFRDQAYIERWNMNSKLRFDIDDSSDLTATFNFHEIPDMGDPGALNAAEVLANRRAANPGSLTFDGSENRSQQRLGLVYRNALNDNHEITLRNYYTWLEFGNKLAFAGGIAQSNGGLVEFDRFFMGGGGQWTWTGTLMGRPNRFIAGFEIDHQEDDRQRYINAFGIKGGLTFDQLEEVDSRGVYAQNELALTDNLELTVGVRYDEVEFKVSDRFFLNNSGDDSGKLKFDEWSPRVGLMWSPAASANLYFNYSTAFETPTTTELANPLGGGFNRGLGSQTAANYEIGIKGSVPAPWSLDYDVAAFWVEVDDELVPFEVDGFTGRTFFQNAGSSTRKGVEAALTVRPFENMTASFAYTFLDASFDRFRTATANFDGNVIPGLPEHVFHAEFNYSHPGGFYTVVDALYVGEFYAENANLVETESYFVSNLRLGYIKRTRDMEITPFFGVNNIFNEKYNSNIRINAAFGRYFEPAPDRHIYGGISARYNFL
jgi:iron complex outermembrane receptor protein